MTAAIVNGGREHFGWGIDRYLLADLYDAINAQTRVTGNWKDKPPDIAPWPRPNDKPEDSSKEKVSVANLYKRFTRR